MTDQELWRERVYHPENLRPVEVEEVDDETESWVINQMETLNQLVRESMCKHQNYYEGSVRYGTKVLCLDCGKVMNCGREA